jgi:hypothetical protein
VTEEPSELVHCLAEGLARLLRGGLTTMAVGGRRDLRTTALRWPSSAPRSSRRALLGALVDGQRARSARGGWRSGPGGRQRGRGRRRRMRPLRGVGCCIRRGAWRQPNDRWFPWLLRRMV